MLPGLVTKQQAVEFPQVQASLYNIVLAQKTCVQQGANHTWLSPTME